VLAAYRVLTAYKVPKPDGDLARLAEANLGHYAAIADAGRAAGARVLLVWHPTTDALATGADPLRAPFLDVAARTGAGALDLTAAYRAAGGRVYVDGMHLDATGHRGRGRRDRRRAGGDGAVTTATPLAAPELRRARRAVRRGLLRERCRLRELGAAHPDGGRRRSDSRRVCSVRRCSRWAAARSSASRSPGARPRGSAAVASSP
jgi:hypothetical protein